MLLRDPEQAQQIGKAGRARLVRDFDARRNVRRVAEFFCGALSEPPGTESALVDPDGSGLSMGSPDPPCDRPCLAGLPLELPAVPTPMDSGGST